MQFLLNLLFKIVALLLGFATAIAVTALLGVMLWMVTEVSAFLFSVIL